VKRTTTTRALVVAVAVGLGAIVTACDRDDDTDRVRLDNDEAMEQARAGWPEGLGRLVDRGNTAYREGRYDDAADTFREATELAPDVAAGWFGLHMAESARGNHEAADSARMQAEALTPGLGAGHPRTPIDDAGELPEGHPPIDRP
jgi:tetratricopeptide (TPR) repeat protein